MLSVVVSYLRVCLRGRGPGPPRPPEPELGLSRWRLNGPSPGTTRARRPDSQGPASGGAGLCPAPPMAGQASPRPRGSKDMARKVRPVAPSSRVSGWVPAPWVLGHRLAHLEGGVALGSELGDRQSCSEHRDTVTVTPVPGSEHGADSPQGGRGLERRLSGEARGRGLRADARASRSFGGCGAGSGHPLQILREKPRGVARWACWVLGSCAP